MQHTSQKIRQVYNNCKQSTSNLLHISKVKQALDLLKLSLDHENQYDIRQKYLEKTNDQGQEIVFINQQEFNEIVVILTNKIEANFLSFNVEVCKTLRHFNQYMKNRDMVVMDRGAETKVVLRIGEEQNYRNFIKVSVQKLKVDQIQPEYVPHVRLEFSTKNQQDKGKLQKILDKIVKKLEQLIKSIILGDEGDESQYTNLMKFLKITTRTTSKGAQIFIQLVSFQLNQAIQTLASCLDKAFNSQGNVVQGKLKLAFQFNQHLKYLLDKSQPYSVFDILSKNLQISASLSLGQLMSAIKEIIIQSQQFSELKYQKFHIPGLLAIALSNMQQLQTIIQLNNVEFTQQQKQLIQSYVITINSVIEALTKTQQFQQICAVLESQFSLSQLLSMLGNQINIGINLKYFVGSVEICIDGLGSLLKKVVSFANRIDQ